MTTWEKLVSVAGAGSSTTLSSGTITAKKHLKYTLYVTAFVNGRMTFNSDTGSNYTRRYSGNGGTDGTGNINQAYIESLWDLAPALIVGNIINIATSEKLITLHTSEANNTTGAGTAPNRMEIVAKWANTSNQITQIDFNKTGTNFGTGEVLTIWGSDDPVETSFNVPNGTIFEESDTGKHYMFDGTDTWNEMT